MSIFRRKPIVDVSQRHRLVDILSKLVEEQGIYHVLEALADVCAIEKRFLREKFGRRAYIISHVFNRIANELNILAGKVRSYETENTEL